jgi:hypothetical protein
VQHSKPEFHVWRLARNPSERLVKGHPRVPGKAAERGASVCSVVAIGGAKRCTLQPSDVAVLRCLRGFVVVECTSGRWSFGAFVGAFTKVDFRPVERSRLRRLVPDEALLERRAGGEPLRPLADDYQVAHTTLLRWFRRPEVARELPEARRRVAARRKIERAKRARQEQAERAQRARLRQAAKAERALEPKAEQEVKKRALEEAERDRELAAWMPPEPRVDPEHAWLDTHEAPRVLSSGDRYSANSRRAAEVVAAGGGIAEVMEATGLSRLNVLQTIDAQIVVRALGQGRRRRPAKRQPSQWSQPEGMRLRRLAPDTELIRRRAAGEPLRELAEDYGVSHTSLSRFFRRPDVRRQMPRRRARRSR